MSVDPLDRITVENYEPDGLTRIGWLPNARGCQWMEENSKPGWASFEIPIDDPSSSDVVFRNILKLKWWHHGVPIATFACRMNGEVTQHATEDVLGRRWMRFENQPGVMGMLSEATVYPQRGITSDAETTRYFGWMFPEDNPWYIAADWGTPVGRAWEDTAGSYRFKKPRAFHADPTAQWISTVDPDQTQAADSANYFRATIGPFDEEKRVEICYTADGHAEFFHNNKVIASGRHDWTQGYRVEETLDADVQHLFAVKVKTRLPGPIAFICMVRVLKPNGDPDSTVLLRTNTEDWTAHPDTPEPGWHRANVLRRLIEEAKDRGGTGVDNILYGFGNVDDSDGVPWTDRGTFPFDVGQVSVADVATQLSESFMDVWVDPKTMRIHAYNRRGRDRSGSIQLDVGKDGGTLKSYETTARTPRFTVLIAKTRDGSWVEVEDTGGGWGRIERGMTLGGASGAATAQRVMESQLNENAHARTYATAETTTLTGPIPYKDYDIGDTISVPKRRADGYMNVRVLAITVDGTGEGVRAWPEFVQETGDG